MQIAKLNASMISRDSEKMALVLDEPVELHDQVPARCCVCLCGSLLMAHISFMASFQWFVVFIFMQCLLFGK